MKPYHITISCEHGGNIIPNAYKYLFREKEEVLETHRGYDIGAKTVSEYLSDNLRAKLFLNEISRLLIDLNRSEGSSELFSSHTKVLKKSIKQYLLDQYYFRYRNAVENYISNHIKHKPVLHLSVHSFTPIMNGIIRSVDVGLLFDEHRETEFYLCKQWKDLLTEKLSKYNIMLNVPYRGSDDGFTTYLRTKFPADKYMGIEIEINQKYNNSEKIHQIAEELVTTLNQAIELSQNYFLINQT